MVLVNGKRRHVSALLNINGTVGRGSAAVDLNLIPGLSINRVEVLRDGAAAQYGSDAIAGVINIQLKSADHGGRASLTYGQYWTTIDDVAKITGLQLDAAGQPQLDPADPRYFLAITDGERKARDGTQATVAVNLGLPIGSSGFINVTGEFRNRDDSNRAGYDLRPNFVRPTATSFDPREVYVQPAAVQVRRSGIARLNLVVNAGFEVSPGLEALCLRLIRASPGGKRRELAAAEQCARTGTGARLRRTRRRPTPTSSR